jgi:hypothetical protein
MPTLSQLSYGPLFVDESSGEIEIVRPIDAAFLVVFGVVQAKLNLRSAHELPVGEEEATVKLLAVGRDASISPSNVFSPHQTIAVPPRRVAANDNDFALTGSPLALNPIQPPSSLQNEVTPAALTERPVDVEAELDRGERDSQLGDVSLLIGREHTLSVVATSDDTCCRKRLRSSRRGLDRHRRHVAPQILEPVVIPRLRREDV